MKKQVTYFDPRCIGEGCLEGQSVTIIAYTEEELNFFMNELNRPERNIPQDSIIVTDATLTLNELKNELATTDYKITKCMEYSLVGLELPYDMQELHTKRQELRDKINSY